MTDDSATPPETDIDSVPRALGPADPVSRRDRHYVSATAPTPDRGTLRRSRRRPMLIAVTAGAAAAALISAAMVVKVAGNSKAAHHPSAPSGRAAVLAAYATTVRAESAQGSASFSLGSTSVTVDGVADLATNRADLTLQLPAPIGRTEVRSTGQEYFVHLPSKLMDVAGGKPWVRVDRAAFQALAGNQLGLPGLGTTLNFAGILNWLRDVSGQITTVGPERIGGTATTHYRAQVDLSRIAASLGADPNESSALGRAVEQTVPVDVWIDAQGRLCQLKTALDLRQLHLPTGTNLPTQARGTAAITVDLWDFGVAVNPVPPAASQVADASSLIEAVAGHPR